MKFSQNSVEVIKCSFSKRIQGLITSKCALEKFLAQLPEEYHAMELQFSSLQCMTTKGLGLGMRIRNYTCVSEVRHNVMLVAWKRVKEQLKTSKSQERSPFVRTG